MGWNVFFKYIYSFNIRQAPRAGKKNHILHCDWLPEWASKRYLPFCISEESLFMPPYNESSIDRSSLFGQDGWILASFFFGCLWTSASCRSLNAQKWNLANIQPS